MTLAVGALFCRDVVRPELGLGGGVGILKADQDGTLEASILGA